MLQAALVFVTTIYILHRNAYVQCRDFLNTVSFIGVKVLSLRIHVRICCTNMHISLSNKKKKVFLC